MSEQVLKRLPLHSSGKPANRSSSCSSTGCRPSRIQPGARRPGGRQLSEGRRKRLTLVAVGLLRRGDPPTPFAREGLLIAALRSAIVGAGGWTWRAADQAAREVVREALRQLGAKRPSWTEASTPNHAQAGTFSLIERTRCRNCGDKLPRGNRAFCSAPCNSVWHAARRRAEDAANQTMLAEAL